MRKAKKKDVKFSGRPFDFTLCITVFLLLALGIIMVLSASSPSALAETGDSYKYVKKQARFAVLGIIAMLVISKIDYRHYKKLYKLAYVGSIIGLALVPLIGYDAGGAKRWINVMGISIQPSELAKIGFIIFFAAWLTKNRDQLHKLFQGFIKPFLFLVPALIILLIFQDHLSASIVIILITSVMMIVAGSRLLHFVTFGSAGIAAGGVGLYVMAKYMQKGAFRLARITSFLDPWQDARDSGWQIIQSLYAIGSGGLFGVGLRRE